MEESQPEVGATQVVVPYWADAFFGNVPPDSKEANLLALACALLMGNLEVAHHYYKRARQAGAQDADLQNVTAIVSRIAGADLTPLAFETVWQALEEPAGPAFEEGNTADTLPPKGE